MDYKELATDLLERMHSFRRMEPQKNMGNFLRGEAFVMHYLDINGGTALPGEMSSEICISSARMAATLNSLEDKGMISREISKEDRRKIVVKLTDKGKAFADHKQAEVMEHMVFTLTSLGEQDSLELIRILDRIIAITDEQNRKD